VASVGHVDILIANHARPFAFTPAQEGTDEEMERLMSSIFYPMHRMIKAVLPQMLKRKNGKIVVASSVNAIKGRAGGATLYSASHILFQRIQEDRRFPPADGRSSRSAPGLNGGMRQDDTLPRRA